MSPEIINLKKDQNSQENFIRMNLSPIKMDSPYFEFNPFWEIRKLHDRFFIIPDSIKITDFGIKINDDDNLVIKKCKVLGSFSKQLMIQNSFEIDEGYFNNNYEFRGAFIIKINNKPINFELDSKITIEGPLEFDKYSKIRLINNLLNQQEFHDNIAMINRIELSFNYKPEGKMKLDENVFRKAKQISF